MVFIVISIDGRPHIWGLMSAISLTCFPWPHFSDSWAETQEDTRTVLALGAFPKSNAFLSSLHLMLVPFCHSPVSGADATSWLPQLLSASSPDELLWWKRLLLLSMSLSSSASRLCVFRCRTSLPLRLLWHTCANSCSPWKFVPD